MIQTTTCLVPFGKSEWDPPTTETCHVPSMQKWKERVFDALNDGQQSYNKLKANCSDHMDIPEMTFTTLESRSSEGS